MNCSTQPCANGGTCLIAEERSGGYTCACPEGFTGDDCTTLSGGTLGVQVIAAIAACGVTILMICLIFVAAVTYSLWRKYSDRNAIHVRSRRSTSRSVYDKSHRHGRDYIDSRYDPERYNFDMYENKAAMIAKRWDSQEELDSGFLGDKTTTEQGSRTAKLKSVSKDSTLEVSAFERNHKMRSTPKDTNFEPDNLNFAHWKQGDNLDDEDIDLSHFTPSKTHRDNSNTLGSSMLQGEADLY